PQRDVAVSLSPDGRLVSGAGSGGLVILWDAATGKERKRWQVPDISSRRSLTQGLFTPDSQSLLTVDGSVVVIVWDLASGKRRLVDGLQQDGPGKAVALSADGKLLAVGGTGVRLWEVATGKLLRHLVPAGDEVQAVALSPDGKTVVLASWD